MMTAVPTRARRAAGSSSKIKRRIRNNTIPIEPVKMISWAKGTLLSPMVKVKTTKTALPPKIHQLGRVSSLGANSILLITAASKPCPRKCRARRRSKIEPKITPMIEITGMTSAMR